MKDVKQSHQVKIDFLSKMDRNWSRWSWKEL